jgi:dTDP-4-dehydrorhamnose 3,5-epimerase
VTETRFGAIRGTHGEAAIKVVSVVSGTAFGAYVDTRPTSATFGGVVTVDLVDQSTIAIHPLDPALRIGWPIPVDAADPTQLSAKDAALPTRAHIAEQIHRD